MSEEKRINLNLKELFKEFPKVRNDFREWYYNKNTKVHTDDFVAQQEHKDRLLREFINSPFEHQVGFLQAFVEKSNDYVINLFGVYVDDWKGEVRWLDKLHVFFLTENQPNRETAFAITFKEYCKIYMKDCDLKNTLEDFLQKK